ncbi:MAG: SDR family oxidoreductase [Candidatus Nitronauta litoralis]|uniref:UDP-glucuronate decarboxylase n=1 Tax=Candidatus Nitronauta litoralis TaxID=2705533 RepID=A0A7T0G0G8_9BACT|nr:MAG: SDR family oxidoreductase [Candidatus Nitronauta litoralis]
MPRSLVTGGAGFVGSHLCEYLLDKGHEVICMDNLITGTEDNIAHIKNDTFQFINHDITEPIELEGDLDYLYQFASPASPIDYLQLPIETIRVGSVGTENCLQLARNKNAAFLMASTSEVYGDPVVHPQTESYWGNVNPIGPRSVYDEPKRFSEAITMAYHRTYGVDTRIVRIFNTYGPRMRTNDGRAIPAFMSQALRGESITVFGTGSQTRSFCFVSDLVEGLYRLMMSGYHYPVNIGNPAEMTLLSMAEKVLQVTGSKSTIEFKPLPEDDPKQRRPDISLAREKLDWQPTVELETGLKETLDYFRQQLGFPAT